MEALPGNSRAMLCTICNAEYAYRGGTSNLREHLPEAHPETQQSMDDASGKTGGGVGRTAAGTRPMTSFVATRVVGKKCSPAKSSEISEPVADWVAENMWPASIAHDSGFQHILQYVEPDFVVPSRTHIVILLKKRYGQCQKELQKLLETVDLVAVTTDGGTSKAIQSYVTYTVHFINADWNLVSCVLETSEFQGSHTANRLAEHAVAAVQRVSVPTQKVVAAVHDEARNMMAAGSILQRDRGCANVACAAHMLQTCIHHALDASDPITTLLSSARRPVSHFHHSAQATDRLLSHQHGAGLKVIQYCPAR